MASGSGENQDDNQTREPVDVLREESSAAAAATAAAAAVPPPPAPPSERLQERTHGQLEAGGRNPSPATAAAAAEPPAPAPPSERLQERAHGQPEAGGRNPSAAVEAAAAAQPKDKGIVSPSSRSPAGGKPFLPPRAASVSRAREPSSASGKPPIPRRPHASKGKKPMSAAEVVESGMIVRDKGRETGEDRIDLKDTFDGLLLESRKIRKMEEKDEPEKDQVKLPTMCPEKGYKRSHWRKFLDRLGIHDPNSRIMDPDVSYEEQVLDRHDTHEEHRLLVAVKEVARQHARLGWASEFSRSHKAFNKLIKKVMKWKKQDRWKLVPTTSRKEKLLRFFNSYGRRNDSEYKALHPTPSSGYLVFLLHFCPKSLFQHILLWCFREVIPDKVFTDHVPIVALVTALGVPLRVEYLFQAAGQDLYTGQGSHDNMPRSTSCPSHPHQIPADHKVPRVTVLYTVAHYDIIYPHPDAAVNQHSDEAESPTSGSTSQDQGGSCSGEKSGKEQIA
ncbi:hypothetical protein HU200_038627 [Digitaria exilis]|uniref:Ubiquitinyl hydrolase 1 n=1 Tax=Digitaria exilis TaxID=1010633 RepID=A0A835BAG2_9POAL|nr:hypothetical protein HU200_038627 [Digitaria exilis]